jgi:hypothetical protein
MRSINRDDYCNCGRIKSAEVDAKDGAATAARSCVGGGRLRLQIVQ